MKYWVRSGLRTRGIQIAGAFGRYAERGIRIGHMGDIRLEDIDLTMDAIQEIVEG